MSAFTIPPDYARRGLTVQAEAKDLVELGTAPGGKTVLLSPEAADAWKRMRNDAFRDGITLVALSGFRSIERQRTIIQRRLDKGESLEAILKTVAAPGFSEHHTGRAVDVGIPEAPTLTEAFADTPAYAWMTEHAGRYGFVLSYPRGNPFGISFEPWHWCFRAI